MALLDKINYLTLPNKISVQTSSQSAAGVQNWKDGSSSGSVRTTGSSVQDVEYKIGQYAVAEGSNTKAQGQAAHAEGTQSVANGVSSHAEGVQTKALGNYSHAEGYYTQANGTSSHVEGMGTKSTHTYQHVFGTYNKLDLSSNSSNQKGTYVEIVGNGSEVNVIITSAGLFVRSTHSTSSSILYELPSGTYEYTEIYNDEQYLLWYHIIDPVDGWVTGSSYIRRSTAVKQSNARTLDWQGNEVLSGKLTVGIPGTNPMDVATVSQLSDTKVTQNNTTSNVLYPVILANSNTSNTETAGVKKSLSLVFNPTAKELMVDDISNISYMSSTGFASQIGENAVFLNPSELNFTNNSAYAYFGNKVTVGNYNWIETAKGEQSLYGIGLNTRVASRYKFSFDAESNGIRLYKYARESYADGSIQEDNYVTDHVQITSGSVYLRTYTYNESTTGGSVNEVLHITPTYIDIGTASGGSSRITKAKIDTWDSYTDTKNTTGSTNTSSKIFLVGATSQAANPQTYSHDTAYVGTDGHLYSNSRQVVNVSNEQTLTNKTLTSPIINEPAVSTITTVTQASFWTVNSTNTNAVSSFQAYRCGNLMSVRMNINTKSTVDTDTTTTLGTVGTKYKSATLVYANVRSHTSPYAPYTGGSVWITGDTINCRLPGSVTVNLSLVYLINPDA